VPTPCSQTIQWLWDKRKTYELASQLAIPAPRTWRVKELKDLDQIEGHFPVALKPAIKEHFIYVTRAKAWRADNLDQLRALFNSALQFMPADEILIQDLIPGSGRCQYAYCALFKDAEPVASLVARRLRQHPLEFGRASTYVESIELPYLAEMSERFLRAVDYYGLVEIEYKYDERDGAYKLLDANARTWGYNSIGQAAGVDFPFLLYLDQMGKPSSLARGRPGVRWVRLLTDLPTGALAIMKTEVTGLDYLRSLIEVDEEAVFNRRDPLPGLVECALAPYLFFKRGF
jgi:predicted ATP-grasp superfamily ATP-dependent carboligase